MSRREALRATALVAARASAEAQITMVEAMVAVQAAPRRGTDARSTEYREALAKARLRAVRA